MSLAVAMFEGKRTFDILYTSSGFTIKMNELICAYNINRFMFMLFYTDMSIFYGLSHKNNNNKRIYLFSSSTFSFLWEIYILSLLICFANTLLAGRERIAYNRKDLRKKVKSTNISWNISKVAIFNYKYLYSRRRSQKCGGEDLNLLMGWLR